MDWESALVNVASVSNDVSNGTAVLGCFVPRE